MEDLIHQKLKVELKIRLFYVKLGIFLVGSGKSDQNHSRLLFLSCKKTKRWEFKEFKVVLCSFNVCAEEDENTSGGLVEFPVSQLVVGHDAVNTALPDAL